MGRIALRGGRATRSGVNAGLLGLLKKCGEVIAGGIGGAGGIESRITASPDSLIDN